ncbi:hypothetical protein NDK47_20800 [Brevibacillus ruminantium]|uniref:Uncharacterized protein n=1 Tax=Brevibacillus ruminantium TaxID=2950604 RepID=A0ABY4WBX9_9BACL|nr:hypothetical protein [Brevibacillus ruminantium]USG64563.1 hypothetical protein NDK47_20800 [Brevibacillus ruminantium]
MRKTMTKEAFDQMEDSQLGWACIEQVLLPLRGKHPDVKLQAFRQCNKGQQALMMFRVFFDHACNSREEYYCWVSELLTKPDTWSGVQKGLQYFGADEMLALLSETEAYLRSRHRFGQESKRQASVLDLDGDEGLCQSIDQFYHRFSQVAMITHHRIANTIRNDPHEFVLFEQ